MSRVADPIELNDLETALGTLDYPCSRDEAAEALDDVTLQLADGQLGLGELVAEAAPGRYATVSDLASELRSRLPRRAVGEPYQSEGEG